MKVPYEMIEHAGDAGAIIYGKTLEELFVNAAKAMFEIMIDPDTVEPEVSREFELDAGDTGDLLVRWLSELNYHVSTDLELYSKFDIASLTDTHISASAMGEAIDPDRHEILAEIKAVTYHELYVKKTDEGFEAKVIFDL